MKPIGRCPDLRILLQQKLWLTAREQYLRWRMANVVGFLINLHYYPSGVDPKVRKFSQIPMYFYMLKGRFPANINVSL